MQIIVCKEGSSKLLHNSKTKFTYILTMLNFAVPNSKSIEIRNVFFDDLRDIKFVCFHLLFWQFVWKSGIKLMLIVKPTKRITNKWSLYGNTFLSKEFTKLSHKLWSVVFLKTNQYLLLSTKNVFSCLIENLSKTKVLNDIKMNFIIKKKKRRSSKKV